MSKTYKSVKIEKGYGGWGGPVIVTPDSERDKIVSITGGGIHPLAQYIAELTNATAVDGFNNPVPFEKTACAIVDCGGTLRLGLFPKNNIPTVNVNAIEPSGPLAQHCTPQLYVSGVKKENIKPTDSQQPMNKDAKANATTNVNASKNIMSSKSYGKFDGVLDLIEKVGRFAGFIVNVFYQSARESVNMMIKNVIPFMVFLALVNGIIMKSGVGNAIALLLKPLTGSVGGLIIFALIIGFPFLSPLLGPGAVIQSILGVFIGTSISTGIVPVNMALPALFAISVVDACDFIPVAASLGEADPDTARLAVPAMLFSRFITAPITVLIGYIFSIGLF